MAEWEFWCHEKSLYQDANSDIELKALGKKGWEFVSVVHIDVICKTRFYFKRPIINILNQEPNI